MPASLNPLTQLTTYIPMASALLGATIGGAVAWINLNRQFKEQRKKELIQERKQELIALNSVLKELNYNYEQLEYYATLKFHYKLKNEKIDNYNEINLKDDKWIKHSDVIEYMDNIKFLIDLQNLYLHINNEIKQKNADYETYSFLSDKLYKLIPDIESHLKQLKEVKKTRR